MDLSAFVDVLKSPSTFEWHMGETPLTDWKVIPITWVIYFATIFFLKNKMSSRNAYSLKYVTALHNLILCVWSAIMCYGLIVEILKILQTQGVQSLYCDASSTPTGAIYYWLYIYWVSKFYELLDTVIIVLKKRPLIFLHVYHHAVVVLMMWLWVEMGLIYASIGAAINTFIHVIMYYYYMISSLGYSPWWKKYITSIQIIQFVGSFLLSVPYVVYAVSFDENGNFVAKCNGFPAFVLSFFVNLSFLYLFASFYRSAYSKTTKKE